MTDLVAAANKAVDLVKRLREVYKAVEQAEAKMLLADLTMELSEVKMGAAELRDQITALKDENTILRSEISKRSEARPDLSEDCYVFPGDDARYCVACYSSKSQRIPMGRESGPFTVFGKWKCPSCKTHAGPSQH